VKYRHRVLILLATLSVITYLDRVCISVAGPRMQAELGLSPQDWGLVTGAFGIAYALFEIPSGFLGDRFGARAMLTRIVLWWSAFTSLTGFASRLWSLVIIRFFFGVGEAGAYPTAATSIFRWYPAVERGRAFGVVFLSSQLGAAIAPLIIVPIQLHFGWRASFYLFGIVGVAWAGEWWRWYRNNPRDKPGISARELAEIGPSAAGCPHAFPWKAIAVNQSVWAIMAAAFTYLYAYYFFLFWLPTYMVQERGFTEAETKLSALPFVLGAITNLAGGYARDAAVGRWGATVGPRVIAMTGIIAAALSVYGAFMSANRYVALAWLALCYAGITFQQPTVFTTCVEIGQRYAGAVAGCMNTAAALGGLSSSLLFGYMIQRSGSYDPVLLSMAGMLVIGAVLWLRIDAREMLAADVPGEGPLSGNT
jgi:sugar phosphate permease